MSKTLTLCYEHEHDYKLIGINSTIEDHRLAYLLNQNLEIHLKRQPNDLDFAEKECSFTLYNYDCEATFSIWSLLANKHFFLSETNENNLFGEESKVTYLINEKRNVDYFLKINGEFEDTEIRSFLEKIKNIKGIITCYSIDPETLKSKDFLIF